MNKRILIVGGGAAGFFAAITCAEAAPDAEVFLYEKSPHFLTKVRISGGGRCNVTHACFDARILTSRYPRGERALIAPFIRFQPSDVVEWFAVRGVTLKTEADGRMFPTTDSSQTIMDCLLRSARTAGVQLFVNQEVKNLTRQDDGKFLADIEEAEPQNFDRVLLATGGCRAPALAQLALALGHTLADPVPSLFTFHIETPCLRELAGVSVAEAEVWVPNEKLRERGPVLCTHWGLSGPAILRLSAWGARSLHVRNYAFPLCVNWLPNLTSEQIAHELDSLRATQPAKRVVNTPISPLPGRLWEKLVLASGIDPDTRWTALLRTHRLDLAGRLHRSEFQVTGKSLNKDEFVTCGGVRLAEVDFKTMESRLCPGLYFAGELLDIDGITGGYNFQAAWTTGWIAGNAMAK